MDPVAAPARSLPVPVAFDDFDELSSFAAAKASGSTSLLDALLVRATQRTGEVVAWISGQDVRLSTPFEVDAAWCDQDGGVHVGVPLLRSLDRACVELAHRLVCNYLTQTSSLGPAVPLPLLKSARDFPLAALELHASNMLPQTVDPTGRRWSDFEVLAAAMRRGRPGATKSIRDFRAMHGGIVLPFLFGTRGPTEEEIQQWLSGEPLPHFLLLYARILSDSLALVVAHELAHVALGHTRESAPTQAREREDEVAADRQAIAWLGGSDAFDLRCAALLFSFLAQLDGTTPLDRLSHPFARDRLGVLVGAVSERTPARVVADLNAAFRLIRRAAPLEGADAEVPGSYTAASFASDLYYHAYLRVEPAAGLIRADHCYEVRADLALRDRVHPARVLRAGHATARVSQDMNDGALDVTLAAPPSWWLDVDGAVLSVERVRIHRLPPGALAAKAAFQSGRALTEAETLDHLRRVAAVAPATAMLAVHVAPECEPEPLALAMVLEAVALGDTNHGAPEGARADVAPCYTYGDLAWAGRRLLDGNEPDRAARILERAVVGAPFVSKRTRGLLAEARLQLLARLLSHQLPSDTVLSGESAALYDGSLDLCLREMAISASDPDRDGFAERVLGPLLTYPGRTPFAEAILEDHRTQEATRATGRPGADPGKAAEHFAAAAARYQRAIALSDPSLVYPHQRLGEALFQRAMAQRAMALGNHGFDGAIACFERVLCGDPSFLPALTELAKIAMERDDLAATGDLLRRAFALGPSHEFAHYVHDEYQRRLTARRRTMVGEAESALRSLEPERLLRIADAYLRIAPDESDAHFLRAVAHHDLGRLESAQDALVRALSLDGEDFMRVAMLGQIQVEMGDVVEANRTLTVLLGSAEHSVKEEQLKGPTTAYLPYSGAKGRGFARAARAVAYACLGQTERARGDLSSALEQCPTGGLALLDCAEVLWLTGDAGSAREMAERAVAATELVLSRRHAAHARRFAAGEAQSALPLSSKARAPATSETYSGSRSRHG